MTEIDKIFNKHSCLMVICDSYPAKLVTAISHDEFYVAIEEACELQRIACANTYSKLCDSRDCYYEILNANIEEQDDKC
jgi:hypothetical protein